MFKSLGVKFIRSAMMHFFGNRILLFAYEKLLPVDMVSAVCCKIINRIAYRGHLEIQKVKLGSRLKKELARDLDEMGNAMDDAWDMGLRGELLR